MRTDAYRVFPLVALALLAAGTLWLERLTQGDEQRSAEPLRHDPAAIVDKFILQRFDASGARQYELRGERMIHYRDDRSTELFAPRLSFVTPDARLYAHSDRGMVFDDGDRVELTGNVEVLREASASRPPARLVSRSLTVWPREERARSTDPVEYAEGKTLIEAQSMSADSLFGQLELGGRVFATLSRRPAGPP